MGTDPRRWIATLRASHEQLQSRAAHFDSQTLGKTSYASQWSIAQVLSHLGSQAEIYAMCLAGSIEQGAVPGREAFQPIWDSWNGRTPERQASDSLLAMATFIEALEALTDGQLADLRVQVPNRDLDLIGFVAARLSEQAIHSWDIAVVLEPGAQIFDEAIALLIDTLLDRATRLGKSQDKSIELTIETTEPTRRFLLTIDDTVRLTASAERASDGVLQITSEGLVRLMFGRLDPQHTPPTKLDSNSVKLDNLRAVFPGP